MTYIYKQTNIVMYDFFSFSNTILVQIINSICNTVADPKTFQRGWVNCDPKFVPFPPRKVGMGGVEDSKMAKISVFKKNIHPKEGVASPSTL